MTPDFSRLLNPEQLKAVQSSEGPILILAGAGSGKTRVITYRIACMLARGIPQLAILAVTFTNKAAREMSQRVKALCGKKLTQLTLCTFHAFGVQVLREHGHILGYRNNFSIYDETDRQALLKEAARDIGLLRSREDTLDLYSLAGLFSRIKSETSSWEEQNERFQPLFKEYQSRLRLFNAVDFDDLICLPIELLESSPEVLDGYRHRYRYFMVDEFQDTSLQQYRLMRLLARQSQNLCVVGDDDQSIYSWRGAHFENLLLYEQDFPHFLVIKLEHNYRSTRRILAAANGLIRNNTSRKDKTLWCTLGEGDPLTVILPQNEGKEGQFIAEKIQTLALKERTPLSQFGVLVRTNSLTRAIEEAFVRENLPYAVSGGLSFFQRSEVKDILAYLRVVANPDDDVHFLRIVNTPKRGIGRKTLEAVVETAQRKACSLCSALAALQAATDSPLPEKAKAPLEEFLAMLEEYRERFLTGKKMSATLAALVDRIDYCGHLVQENPRGAVARWKYGNVESLIDSLASYEEDPDNLDPSLFNYLNRVTLLSQEDGRQQDGEEKVQLMTIHSAKGLEFDTVFVAGVEEGLIPHARAIEEKQANLEEERRLFYVALTRARRRLFLSACRSRRRHGELRESGPSPFLEQIPAELLEYHRGEEDLAPEEARRYFEQMKKTIQG